MRCPPSIETADSCSRPEILDEFNFAAYAIRAVGSFADAYVFGADRHYGRAEQVWAEQTRAASGLWNAPSTTPASWAAELDIEEIPETHEVGHEDVRWPVMDLLRRADLHQDALAQHHDAVG